MRNLPRIEVTDPEQALNICCDLLAFIEALAYDRTEDAGWNGTFIMAKLIRHTLIDMQMRGIERTGDRRT